MADSAPEYAVDALDRALQARGAGPAVAAPKSAPESAGSELAPASATERSEEALTLPSLDFTFKAPSFLGNRSRWVLFVLLVAVAALALLLAWDMVKTGARGDGGEWVLPPIFTLVVAAFALAFAFAAVMGFGQVDLRTSIGEGTAEPAPGKPGASGPARGLTVRSTVPPAEATGIGADVQVEAVFSEAVEASTLTSSSFVLRQLGSRAPVAAAVELDADQATARLKPGVQLKAGSGYEVEITTAVKARSGSTLAAARKWTFTTAT